MYYRRKPVDIQSEKNIITGMIVSDRFLLSMLTILKIELLQVSYIKMVASWCIDYYNQYQKAPGNTIEEIFNSKLRQELLDEDEEKLIATFLSKLSNEYEENSTFNDAYSIDQAENYLRKRALEVLKEDIGTALVNKEVEYAESLVGGFKRVSKPSTKGVDVLTDKNAIQRAFEQKKDILLKLPGRLGKIVGPLCRDDFLCIFGPRGRAKSWMILEFCILSALAGHKTLLVSLEMTEPQVMRRIYQRLLSESRFPGKYKIPVMDCRDNQNNVCNSSRRKSSIGLPMENGNSFDVENVPKNYSPCSVCKNRRDYKVAICYRNIRKKGLEYSKAIRKGKAVQKMIRSGSLKLACFPSRSISIMDLKVYLDNLEYYENYIPSVVATDYTDIFRPINRNIQTRHQINETWEYQRGLGQERHILMITGSHTNKSTLERNIKEGDSSEDVRKENHLTHGLALNQTSVEKERGIMRISMTKIREEFFDIRNEVTILQCLHIGRPILDSY